MSTCTCGATETPVVEAIVASTDADDVALTAAVADIVEATTAAVANATDERYNALEQRVSDVESALADYIASNAGEPASIDGTGVSY